jgi:hypothetical protein
MANSRKYFWNAFPGIRFLIPEIWKMPLLKNGWEFGRGSLNNLPE